MGAPAASTVNVVADVERLRRKVIIKYGPFTPSIAILPVTFPSESDALGLSPIVYSTTLLNPSASASALALLIAGVPSSAVVNHWLCQFTKVTFPNRPGLPPLLAEAFHEVGSSPKAVIF